ncbi:MAG: putative MAPEG superfamily protein [Alphaproteobacteria bacterium]|jgi:uncharacterized MAPEG superfamily protein
MTTDLLYLTLSAGLCAVLWIPYVLSRIQTWGLVNAVGYPENPPELPAWAQRAKRVHENMVENLAPFAALVLVAQVTGAANETTALASLLFFWSRVAHAIVFILGIPWLRTLAFFAAWIGLVLIFIEIIG